MAWHYLLLGLAVFVVYGILLMSPFLYDDAGYVLGDPLITGTWPGLKAFFLKPFAGTGEYGPLNSLGHWVLYRLAGEEPPAYRLTSILLHWANAALFLLLCRRLLADKSLALFAALCFALYPAHVEVLALTSFKKHLAVAFFGLLLLHGTAWNAASFALKAGVCWTFFGLALLCKESALMLAFLVPVFQYWAPAGTIRDGRRRRFLLVLGLWVMAAGYLIMRLFVVPRTMAPLVGGRLDIHLFTSMKSLLWSVSQFFVPWDLCLEHSLLPVGEPWGAAGLLILAGAAACAAAVGAARRVDPVAGVGAAWCGLFLLPFLNVVPFLNYSLVAGRYLYMASAGFVLAAVALLACASRRLSSRGRHGLLLAAVAAACGLMGLRYAALFVDPLELWSRTAACAPGNPRARGAFGAVLLDRGLYARAEEELSAAAVLDPEYVEARIDLARVLARTNRLQAAIEHAEAAARQAPCRSSVLSNLGGYLLEAGRSREALAVLERAVRVAPGNAVIRVKLGLCRRSLKDPEGARREFERAAEVPKLRPWALSELARLHAEQGDRSLAVDHYEASLVLDPLQPDTVMELAGLYARAGRTSDAVSLLDRWIEDVEGGLASDPDTPEELRQNVRQKLAQAHSLRDTIEHSASARFRQHQ